MFHNQSILNVMYCKVAQKKNLHRRQFKTCFKHIFLPFINKQNPHYKNKPLPTFWHILWRFIVKIQREVWPFAETMTGKWEHRLQQNKAFFKISLDGIFCYVREPERPNKWGLCYTQWIILPDMDLVRPDTYTQKRIPDHLFSFVIFRSECFPH